MTTKSKEIELNDFVTFEEEDYKVVEIKGQALHLKRIEYPYDSFLVSKDVVTKVKGGTND